MLYLSVSSLLCRHLVYIYMLVHILNILVIIWIILLETTISIFSQEKYGGG